MKIQYHAETDQLYIQLKDAPGHDAAEIADGIVVDYAADGSVVGLDIEHASRKLDMSKLEISPILAMPVEALAA